MVEIYHRCIFLIVIRIMFSSGICHVFTDKRRENSRHTYSGFCRRCMSFANAPTVQFVLLHDIVVSYVSIFSTYFLNNLQFLSKHFYKYHEQEFINIL